MPASPTADRPSGRSWLYRAGVAIALGGCLGIVGLDVYREERTEQALAAIQKAGGFYRRKVDRRWSPVISIDLDATIVYDSGWVRRRGHVTDAIFSLLWRFGQLQELSLDGADLTDAGLVGLRDLRALRRLNLARTRLTDAGLNYLKELAGLRVIDLRGTQVTPAGIQALRRALPMTVILADESKGSS
jgi:hypothetical protein